MNTELAQQDSINSPNPQSSFKKVLVAIDHVVNSREIFEQAVDLTIQFQGRLLICHCLNETPISNPELLTISGYTSISSREIWELEEEALEEATEQLQSEFHPLQVQAEAKGIPTESAYVSGNPGEEICNLAKSWEADIIVMGRRGLSGLSELLFGSVSNYVLHHAPCAVLVIQHEEKDD